MEPSTTHPVTRPALSLSNDMVSIKCSDDVVVRLHTEWARQSPVLRNVIEEVLDKCVAEEDAYTLPNITSSTFNKMVSYWDYHWHHPDSESTGNDICPWDREFCNLPQNVLFDLILDVKPILDICCRTVATALRACKDPEDIRKYLNIKNDYTPEEEAEARRENEWMLLSIKK